MILLLVLVSLFSGYIPSVDAYYKFSVKDCSENIANSSVLFSNFSITPDPVELPGNLSVSGTVTFTKDITGNISLELSIGRSLGFFELPLPCIDQLGSCQYLDVCSILEEGNATLTCAQQLKDIGFPCSCPFLNGTYVVQNIGFELPELKGGLASFATGDYSVKLQMVDLETSEVLGCQTLEFTLAKPQTSTTKKPCGFFCRLIG